MSHLTHPALLGAYMAAHPVARLRTAEQFILCAMRMWGAEDGALRCGRAFLPLGFQAAGLSRGDFHSFDAVLSALAAAMPGFAVAPLGAPALSPVERQFLQALSECQHRTPHAACALSRRLPLAAARIALGHMRAIGRRMAEAGLLLPLRPHPAWSESANTHAA